MTGGLMQLVAKGAPDIYITDNPNITFFKIMYRRYTEFALVDDKIKINNDPQFGAHATVQIHPIADLLTNLTLVVDIEQPNIVSLIAPALGIQPPKYAWVKYLGYKLVKSVELIVDGETIDSIDSDLLLILNETFNPLSHQRGINNMIGNIPEMYTINSTKKPKMRLYIGIPFWFNRYKESLLPLVGLIHSNVSVKINYEDFDKLFYLERGGKIKNPAIIHSHLIGTFVYLGADERKYFATSKVEQLMDRFTTTGKVTQKIDKINEIKLYFEDPCKFLLFRFTAKSKSNKDNTDIVYWNISGYPKRDSNNQIIQDIRSVDKIIKKIKIELNDKTREDWKEMSYFQNLQPYYKKIQSLSGGHGIYSFALFPRDLQPSGTTNFSYIDSAVLNVELTDFMKTLDSDDIEITYQVWACTYNIFVTMSGLGALLFYGSK